MQSLYRNGLEYIYDAMYQTFINYKDEFTYYNSILNKKKCKTILEIGCGTGNLASYFINSDKDYIGLDLSEEMIDLSKQKNPSGCFIQADIKGFSLNILVDAIVIPGRTSSYLLNNEDISEALHSIHKCLNPNGILIFDFIDANRFFKQIEKQNSVTHKALYQDITYSRDSIFKIDKTMNNFMFNWKSSYYKHLKDEKLNIAEDDSTVRAFVKEEWSLLLELNGFEVEQCLDRKSYAFDTYVIIARKINTTD